MFPKERSGKLLSNEVIKEENWRVTSGFGPL
jgi:hypothetical protein